MKKQLFLIAFTIFTSWICKAQIPANDVLSNATLVNSFPFVDTDINLDLATSNSISPSDCPVGGYNLVYYKFTATSPTQLNISIEDANDEPIGQSFIIVFSAPSLNISNETELTLASDCVIGTSASIYPNIGSNYYVLVHRLDLNKTSNVIFEEASYTPIPDVEKNALLSIYNSTNGDNWTNNNNWGSDLPVDMWYGINTSMINGVNHVTEINLGGNSLSGQLPSEIGDFPELTHLMLWANQLTGPIPPEIGNLVNLVVMDLAPNTFTGSIPQEIGNLVNLEILWLNQNGLSGVIPMSLQNLTNLRELYLMGAVGTNSEWSSSSYEGDFPDLTALPLEILRLENNFFHFDDIVDEFNSYQATIPSFTFNPQYTIDPPEEISSDVGEDIVLTLTDISDTERNSSSTLTLNNYQWFKDGEVIPGATSDTYVIVNAQNSDSGVYYCEITNPDIPDFLVRRSNIDVSIGTLNIDDSSPDLFQIYPNPFKDILYIENYTNAFDNSLEIFDILGKRVLKSTIYDERMELDLSQLQSGIYLVKLTSEGSILIKKLIKK